MTHERNNATPDENWAFNTAIKIEKEKSKQEIINKACNWLEENLLDYWSQLNANNTEGFIKEFKKAMEE